MIRIWSFIAGFILLNITVSAQKDSSALQFAEIITPALVSEYLHVLASDSLEGREAGAPGQKKAAMYLKDQFEAFGLEPLVKTETGKSYFQSFNLVRRTWNEVYINVGKSRKTFLADFYAYGDVEFAKAQKIPVVFGGYGINSEKYSDYKNIDVKGKGVVIFMGEPFADGKSLVSGKASSSDWAQDWRRKATEAKKQGAEAVFIVVGSTNKDFENRLNALKHHLGQPALSFDYKQRGGSAFFVPVSLAAEMLKTTEAELQEARKALADPAAKRKKFKSAQVEVKVSVDKSVFDTENVLAFLEGNEKKDEVIVVTAHYDHLGIEDGRIYYGADDNASGTAAVVAVAKAFSEADKDGKGPKRSILFMPVTAEEKGLLGSEYYTDRPVIPLENTVANINIDMIGRIDTLHQTPDYIYLIGSDRLSTTLHAISEKAASTYTPDIELDYRYNKRDDPNRFYYRSDHYNFAKNNIPVIFYFNGVHEDYHQPTDTVDKIDFEKVSKISRLIFYTLWDLANYDQAIEVDVEAE